MHGLGVRICINDNNSLWTHEYSTARFGHKGCCLLAFVVVVVIVIVAY